MGETAVQENPLAAERIGKLIAKFAIPAIISMLVSSLYNIVDQIFIGQGVGMLGNAATNIAFPISIICTATALLLGIGSASNYNLESGAGNSKKASQIVGTGLAVLIISGITIGIIVLVFLDPLLHLFGVTPDVLPLAQDYTGITAFGIPFLILTTGGNHLIRADGSPTYSMISMVSGALINTVLDPLFIFTFGWGIAGAAWATVTGQVFSACLVLFYLPRYKTVELKLKNLIPRSHCIKAIASLGMASCFNQLALTVVQITMNNVLRHYGSHSVYGSDIPLAVVGIVAKVNMVFLSIVIGIAQGSQPIVGFNYGAKNYSRVKKTYLCAAGTATILAVTAFICFQIFPRQIVSLFGSGDKLYYQFAQKYFRIFMFCTFLNGLQPVTANFFTSIGKATRGIVLSMTRQILFLIPMILIFPLFMGIDGVMYAGPIADAAAGILAVLLVRKEIRRMPADGELPA